MNLGENEIDLRSDRNTSVIKDENAEGVGFKIMGLTQQLSGAKAKNSIFIRRSLFSPSKFKDSSPSDTERSQSKRSSKSPKFQKTSSENFNKTLNFNQEEVNFIKQEECVKPTKNNNRRKSFGNFLKSTWSAVKKNISLQKNEKDQQVHSSLKSERNSANISAIARINQAIGRLKTLVSFKSVSLTQFKLINDWAWFGNTNNIEDETLREANIRKFSFRGSIIKMYQKIIDPWKKNMFRNILHKSLTRIKSVIERVPIFNPKVRWKMTWDLIMMLLTFWNFMIISIGISFSVDLEDVFMFSEIENPRDNYYYFIIVCLISIILDSLFTVNTSYFEMGVLVSDRRKILKNFIHKRFTINVITLIPFILQILTYHSSLSPQSIKLFNCLFFLKYYSLLEIFKILEEILSLEEKSSAIFSFIQLSIKLYFVAHFLGCIWHIVAMYSVNQDKNSWLNLKNLSIDDFWTERYIYSVYYSLTTMTTVGYGDIIPQNSNEVIAAMITMLVGSAMFGYGINSIGELLKKINFREDQLKQDERALNKIMKHKKIDYDLHTRARKYLEYIWNDEKDNQQNEDEVMSKLSNSIKEEILLQSNGKILKKFPMLYKNFSEKTMRKLIYLMKPMRFSPEEIIVEEREESIDSFLYFITQGEITISLDAQKRDEGPCTVITLKEGNVFGEISFFTDLPQMFTARSLKYSTVYKLRKGELLSIIRENDEDWEKYCMLRDKMTIYNNFEDVKIQCYCCQSLDHYFNKCPVVFYIPSKKKTIEKYRMFLNLAKTKRKPLPKPRKLKKFNALQYINYIKEGISKVDLPIKELKTEKVLSSNKNIPDSRSLKLPEGENLRLPEKSGCSRSSNKSLTSLKGLGKKKIEINNQQDEIVNGEGNSEVQHEENDGNGEEFKEDFKKESETESRNEIFMMNFDASKNFTFYFQHNNPEIVVLKLMVQHFKTAKRMPLIGGLANLVGENFGKRKIIPQNILISQRNTVTSPRKGNLKANFFKDDEEARSIGEKVFNLAEMENYGTLEMTDKNPIKKVIKNLSEIPEASKYQLGPHIQQQTLFILDDQVDLISKRSSSNLLTENKSPEFNLVNTLKFPENPETAKYSKRNISNISPMSPLHNPMNSLKRNSITRFSKRAPLRGSILKGRKPRTTENTITLQELLFKQKLERFIRNLRMHSCLNDMSRLTLERLNIIDDLGASNSEILKERNFTEVNKLTSELMRNKINQRPKLAKRVINYSKQTLHKIHKHFDNSMKITYIFIEENIPVLKPFGKFKITWDLLMLLLTIWNLLSYTLIFSFRISMQESISYSIPYLNNKSFLWSFQIICLILYNADGVIKLNTSYYLDGEPVQDRKKIFKNYLATGLLFDIISIVPFWNFLREGEKNKYLFFILFKIYPLQSFFKNINEALLSIEGKLEAAYYLVKLMLTVLVVCHVFACFWHLQAIQNDPLETNWLTLQNLRNSQWQDRYLRSLYFTVVTMTTVGYGDISPSNSLEYFIAMACMFIGSGLIGYSINSIGAILRKMNKGDSDFRNKMQVLNSYFKKNNVEESLKIRVRKYLEYIWKIENSANDKKCEEIMKELPNSLREELFTQSRVWTLKCMFSDKLKNSTIRKISNSLVLAQYSKEEWIFKEGDLLDNTLYIIAKGTVNMILNEGKSNKKKFIQMSSKSTGEIIGLNSFLIDQPKFCSAKAASVCSVFKLSKEKFIEILKEDPEDYEIYCMMKDKILLYNDMSILGRKCKSCGDINHTILRCPFLTYEPIRGIIIKRHLFSKPQIRKKYKRKMKSKFKFRHTLLTAVEVRNSVNNFQEQKLAEMGSLSDFYLQQIENLAIMTEGGRDYTGTNDDVMTETKRKDESKELAISNKDELNAMDENIKNLPLNLTLKNPTFADIQSPIIDSEIYNREDRLRSFFNFSNIQSPIGKLERNFSRDRLLDEIKNDENIKSSKDILAVSSPAGKNSHNFEEILNTNQRIEERRLEERKESLLSIGTKRKPTLSTKMDKSKFFPLDFDHKEELEKTNIHSQRQPKTFQPLFCTDFDVGSTFSKYFSYNNRQVVVDKLHKDIERRKDQT